MVSYRLRSNPVLPGFEFFLREHWREGRGAYSEWVAKHRRGGEKKENRLADQTLGIGYYLRDTISYSDEV